MIFTYTIEEKVLKEASIRVNQETFRVVISQDYISFLVPGPWLPFGIKTSRVYDQADNEVKPSNWSDELMHQVKSLKKSVPFQVSLFRNTIIFALFILAAIIIMPRVNQNKLENKEKAQEELIQAIEQVKEGDVFRVIVTKEENNTVSNAGIGLIKVVGVSGDTIKCVRSTQMAEYSYKGESKRLKYKEFGSDVELINKKALVRSGRDFSLTTIPTQPNRPGRYVGSILGME